MRALVIIVALACAACSGCVSQVAPPAATPASVGFALVPGLVARTLYLADLGCTGVDLGSGMVATAKHCVAGLELGAEAGGGTLLRVFEGVDLALLARPDLVQLGAVCVRDPVLGEPVYSVGYPKLLGSGVQELTVTDGIVSSVTPDVTGEVRTTAPVYFGNSGGGVWSATDGCLVGIAVSITRNPAESYMVALAGLLGA